MESPPAQANEGYEPPKSTAPLASIATRPSPRSYTEPPTKPPPPRRITKPPTIGGPTKAGPGPNRKVAPAEPTSPTTQAICQWQRPRGSTRNPGSGENVASKGVAAGWYNVPVQVSQVGKGITSTCSSRTTLS